MNGRPDGRMDGDTLAALRDTLREVFRSTTIAADVSTALVDLGWAEAHAEDPASTAVALFEEQGGALGSSRELAALMLGSLALPPSGSTRTVALPYPAHDGLPDRPRGVVIGGLAGIDEVVLPIRDTAASGIAVAVVPVGRLSARSVAGLDPAYDLVEVEPTGSPAVVAGEQSWDRAAALGRRLLASELVGVGRAALTLASTHVTDRTQFGRPIGSFQAVRHRLAEAHVHLSAAADLVDEAWHSGLAQDATVAKIVAGRAADATVRASMQVCGAIGLTWEHALHRHVRRAGVLDLLLDGADRLETRLGAELAEKRR